MRTQTQGVGLQSPHSYPLQIILARGLTEGRGSVGPDSKDLIGQVGGVGERERALQAGARM